MGKTVPKVLDTAGGRRLRAVLKTESTAFPNTDRTRENSSRSWNQSDYRIFFNSARSRAEKKINIYHCSCIRLKQKSTSMRNFFRHLSNSQSLVYSWQMSETALKIDEFMRYYVRQVDEVRYLKLS